MVRHAPIHRRSGHSDIAICCGRNARGSSPSTSVVPLSNQVTTLNHKRFKGLKMFSDGHLASRVTSGQKERKKTGNSFYFFYFQSIRSGPNRAARYLDHLPLGSPSAFECSRLKCSPCSCFKRLRVVVITAAQVFDLSVDGAFPFDVR